MMKRKSPVTVQQWVESLPINQFQNGKNSNNTPNQLFYTPNSPQKRNSRLTRDFSLQSDSTGSHCSSVECVLELRRPDPEEVLIGLGFGPSNRSSPKSRIPERFLQPSKLLPQIDIEKFLEEQGNSKIINQQFNTITTSPKRQAKS